MAKTWQVEDYDTPYRYRKTNVQSSSYGYSYGAYESAPANHNNNRRLGGANGYYNHTSSALAPKYQYEEEVAQPQKKTQQKAKQKHNILLQYIPVVLVSFALCMSLVIQYAYIGNLGYQVSHAKTELKNTLAENEKLKRQIASMGELNGVESIAVNEMGMHRPNANEVIYLAAFSE